MAVAILCVQTELAATSKLKCAEIVTQRESASFRSVALVSHLFVIEEVVGSVPAGRVGDNVRRHVENNSGIVKLILHVCGRNQRQGHVRFHSMVSRVAGQPQR